MFDLQGISFYEASRFFAVLIPNELLFCCFWRGHRPKMFLFPGILFYLKLKSEHGWSHDFKKNRFIGIQKHVLLSSCIFVSRLCIALI